MNMRSAICWGMSPEAIAEFDTFYDARRERLKKRIGQLLGRQPSL